MEKINTHKVLGWQRQQKKILYKFPSRERKDKCFAAIDNIIENATHDNYQILCTFDIDDEIMANREVKERINSYGTKVLAVYGTSKNKIDACNRDVWIVPDWDIVCLHSDDMWFTKKGFDLDILDAFEDYSGIVHFPDGHANEKLITYAMLSRDYYDQFGYIYHPDFESVYADNHQMQLAQLLGKYKYVDKKILEHKHPIWGYGQYDDLLKKTEHPAVYQKDMITFQRHVANNFYLNK